MTLTRTPETASKASAPFCLAFGAALVVSSALGAPSPVADWTGTWARLSDSIPGHASETSTGQKIQVPAAAARRSTGETISELRALSGLTADQVGRLLDVSRRTVQNWIAGNTMAIQHEEQVSRLMSVVQSLPGSTSDERRAALLDSSNGESLFQKLLHQKEQPPKIQGQAVSVGERIAL
jgi:DNA-binding transcriptional regulator YiaG